MALSNIFKEPRREIIETILGLFTVVISLTGDYYFTQWPKQAKHIF